MIIHAFNKSLTAAKWTLEPECVVNRRTLENRIRAGWHPIKAISSPLTIQKAEPTPQLVQWKGVKFDPEKKRYAAFIRICGKLKRLGRFLDAEEAARAYNRALANVGNPDRQGFNILEPMF